VGYTPGHQTVPFAATFDVDVSLSNGRVRSHFQEQLSAGRVFVAVTALTVTSKQAPTGYPVFFTKEGALGDPHANAPILTVTLTPSGDLDGNTLRDLDDWGALADCLSGPGRLPSPTAPLTADICLCVFDRDDDGDVDLQDVDGFAKRFTGGN
jgi:hypothetical protein